jgi:phosphate transport system permease protein
MQKCARFGDRAFQWLTLLMALSVFALIVLIGYELATAPASPCKNLAGISSSAATGIRSTSNTARCRSSSARSFRPLIALLIAVPISIATAVYLTELAPLWLRQPLIMFIELLAAVPSVILGLWGIFVMVPWLRDHLFPWLQKTLGFLPLFKGRFTASACWPVASSSPS